MRGADRNQNISRSVRAVVASRAAVTQRNHEVTTMEKSKKEAFCAMPNGPELTESFQKNARRIAAWYIETTENLAKEGLRLRERSISWARDTPLASIFEAQNTMAQQLVENSARFARDLFRIEKEEEKSKRASDA